GLILGLGTPAHAADPVPSLDLRNYRASTDPQALLYLEPVSTPGPAEWNVGAWPTYAYRLVVLKDAEGDEVAGPVQHQVSLDYTAGIGIGERFALGLEVPTVLYQQGDEPPPSLGAGELPTTALGDPSVTAKAALLPPGALGGFGLAALADVSVPLGDLSSY